MRNLNLSLKRGKKKRAKRKAEDVRDRAGEGAVCERREGIAVRQQEGGKG
jgi:hypothetical protein